LPFGLQFHCFQLSLRKAQLELAIMSSPSPQQNASASDSAATGKGSKRGLAVAAGFVVFFVGMIVVSWLLDLLLNTRNGPVFTLTNGVLWVIGAGIVTFLAGEAARRIEPHFSLGTLIAVCVAALLAATLFSAYGLASSGDTSRALGALLVQTIGTCVGIWISARQLRKPT
jgi:peptidoglycan/LPS O-acetylase OafA/YrhL